MSELCKSRFLHFKSIMFTFPSTRYVNYAQQYPFAIIWFFSHNFYLSVLSTVKVKTLFSIKSKKMHLQKIFTIKFVNFFSINHGKGLTVHPLPTPTKTTFGRYYSECFSFPFFYLWKEWRWQEAAYTASDEGIEGYDIYTTC